MAPFETFGTTRDLYFTGSDANRLKHVCPESFGGGPIDDVRTRGVAVDRFIHRDLLNGLDLPLPASVQQRTGVPGALPMWVFGDPDAAANRDQFPGPLIRSVQGEVLHLTASCKGGTHTIHWHGIEPTPMNDGVGKHSFEVAGNFVHQLQTNEAGTYFYHCHKNTTLHFEMGLFGLFIVDPVSPDPGITAPYLSPPGFVAGRLTTDPPNVETIRYDVEKFWVADDFDSRWHFPEPGHNHGMQDCDADTPFAPETFHVFGTEAFELNDFRADIFNVSGVVLDYGQTGPPFTPVFTGAIADPLIAVNAAVGETVLIRFLNAGYGIQELTMPVDITIIAWDGHPLGVGDLHRYSRPYLVPAGTPIRTTSARRFDLIIDTATTGQFAGNARIDYYEWVKGVPNGLIASVSIPVNIG